MTVSLTEKARNGRKIALRALHIRKSGSDRIAIFPCVEREADRIMFSSCRGGNPMHNMFAAA